MAPNDATPPALQLSPQATVEALSTAAAIRWWQTTAFLEVAGPDATSFLDGLCTQAVERIEPGRGVLGLFLDGKAKLIAPAVLHRTADGPWTDPRSGAVIDAAPRLLLETRPELVEPLRAHLARYRLRAKATLEPVELATIALVGATAVEAAIDDDSGGAWSIVDGQALPTRAFVGTPDACARMVRVQLPAAGFALADADAVEAARIERGIADLYDLQPGRMPAEIGGMATAVALDAGCYLGQEPVARLHYRGHANRTLRRMASDGAIAPSPPAADAEPDAHLQLARPDADAGARPLGTLTTWARRPDGSTIALGVLRRDVGSGEGLVLPGTDALLRTLDAPEG